MKTKERIAVLSKQRSLFDAFLSKFGKLEGKFVRQNKKAITSIRQWSAEHTESTLADSHVIQALKFNFDRVRHDIADFKERIHCLDTIDTFDLTRYTKAVREILEIKKEIRQAFGKDLYKGNQELINITGFNFN